MPLIAARLFAILLFFGVALSAVASTELRVVAWNIEWFPGQQARDVTPEMEREHVRRVQELPLTTSLFAVSAFGMVTQ